MTRRVRLPRPRRARPRSARSASRPRAVDHPVEAYAIRVEAGGRSPGLHRRHRAQRRPRRALPRRRPRALRGLVRQPLRGPPARPAPDRGAGRRARERAPGSAGSCSPTSCPGRRRRPSRSSRLRRSPEAGQPASSSTATRSTLSRRPRDLVASTRRDCGEGPVRVARMTRADGRAADQLRPVTFQRGWLDQAEGSVPRRRSAAPGCCARRRSPRACRAGARTPGSGWVTAEYAMLPRATNTRNDRESVKGKVGGRTQEISRLVGRSLRAVGRPLGARREQRSSSTATCCRPTAARARPRSPAPTSRSPTRSSGRAARASSSPTRSR